MWGKCNESVLFHHTSSQEPESEIVDSFSIGVCYSGLDLGRNRGIDLLPLHGYMGATWQYNATGQHHLHSIIYNENRIATKWNAKWIPDSHFGWSWSKVDMSVWTVSHVGQHIHSKFSVDKRHNTMSNQPPTSGDFRRIHAVCATYPTNTCLLSMKTINQTVALSPIRVTT